MSDPSPSPTPSLTDAERLTDLRRQVLEGKEISLEDYQLVIASVRRRRAGDISAAADKPRAQGVARQAQTAKQTKSLAELLAGAVSKKKEQQS